ncbi:MAG: hypothetical protein PHG44_09550, partial [Lentisphaeria bacterium]|nr:hypothetical protein [Lentisphaeria bacterium]
LGCPFGAPNGLNRREKLDFLPKTAFFRRILLLWLTKSGAILLAKSESSDELYRKKELFCL